MNKEQTELIELEFIEKMLIPKVRINYDQPIDEIVLPRKIKSLRLKEIEEMDIKFQPQLKGESERDLVLVEFPFSSLPSQVINTMTELKFQPAGIHELMAFIKMNELPEGEFFVAALRKEMCFTHVQFIPALFGDKKFCRLGLFFLEDIPLKKGLHVIGLR